jgi:hypothetical protein
LLSPKEEDTVAREFLEAVPISSRLGDFLEWSYNPQEQPIEPYNPWLRQYRPQGVVQATDNSRIARNRAVQRGCTTGRDSRGRGFRPQKFAQVLLLFVFFLVGHYSSKGALVCLDIILMKTNLKGRKYLCVEIGFIFFLYLISVNNSSQYKLFSEL